MLIVYDKSVSIKIKLSKEGLIARGIKERYIFWSGESHVLQSFSQRHSSIHLHSYPSMFLDSEIKPFLACAISNFHEDHSPIAP